jgi:hypothetical protein
LFLLWPLLAWSYKSRFANFHQGLSSRQKLEGAAGARAIFAASVFCADEWRTLTVRWQAGIPHAGFGGVVQGAGARRVDFDRGFKIVTNA